MRPFVGVLAWLAVLVAANVAWLQREALLFPPPWDQGFYLYLSVRYRNLMAEAGPIAVWREFTSTPSLPSLFPLTSVPLYLTLGTSRLAAHLTTSVYLVLMVLAVYGLARRLRDDRTAVLAAFLLSTFTAVIHLSRDYLMDFPFATLLTATVYALARSEDLQRRSWSVAAGVLAGLTLLTRIMAPAFLVAPMAVALARAWRRPHRERALRNAALAGLAGAALAATWWARHLDAALHYVAFYGFGAGAAPYDPTHDPLSLWDVTFYLNAIANDGMSMPLAVLLVTALLLKGRRPRAEAAPSDDGRRAAVRQLLVAWFAVGYVALTLSRNKAADRYTVALLPVVAIAMARALLALSSRRRRIAAVGAAIVLGGYNWLGITWKPWWAPQFDFQAPGRLVAYSPSQRWLRSVRVLSPNWPIREALDALSALSGERRRRAARLGEAAVADLSRADVSAEDCVRRAYRRLLKRDPEAEALRAYASRLETGALTRQAFLFGLVQSDEYLRRPLRVLIAADEPFFNFNTLRYSVEAERRPLDLAALPTSGAAPNIANYDVVALLVPDRSRRSPAPALPVETALRAGNSGFRPLDRVFPEEDEWRIVIFVAAGLDGTGPLLREPIECGRWSAGGHLGGGWSWPEEAFRWTDGADAEVFFEADRRDARIVRLSVASFRPGRPDGAREVDVSLNDHPLARWTLRPTASLVRAAVVPSGLLRQRNVLRLHFIPPVLPVDGGADPRALGLAARWIRMDDFPSWPAGRVSWSSEEAEPFLGDGWSRAEAGYRWTDGTIAETFLGSRPTASSLRLRMHPLVTPTWPAQRVALSLNGRVLSSWRLEHPEPREYVVALPTFGLGPANVLRLDTPDARAPVDVGAGADTRSLGVAVHWMQLESAPGRERR